MAKKIDSWKSNSANIFDNEYDALLDDLRGWFIDKAKMNEAIARDTMRAIAIDLPALRDFASIVEAISAAHPGQPVGTGIPPGFNVTVPAARFDPAVEELASRIFWAMPDRPAGLAWTPHGNSDMQDKARDLARQQIEEAAKHVEPAHDIATLTPEQVLDQKRGYTRGEQPFVEPPVDVSTPMTPPDFRYPPSSIGRGEPSRNDPFGLNMS